MSIYMLYDVMSLHIFPTSLAFLIIIMREQSAVLTAYKNSSVIWNLSWPMVEDICSCPRTSIGASDFDAFTEVSGAVSLLSEMIGH
jgi:hypothetical protein